MAHLVGADKVDLRFGTRTIFDGLTLGIDDGDRIGVVGPNGAGKSTLLRLLSGQTSPDSGRITKVSGLTTELVEQRDLVAPGLTVQDVIHGDAATHEWASDAAIRDVHDGLINDLDWAQQVDTLSGGQRRRVALAAALVRNPDLLLLDEPTNHLDVEGVDWLARHLNKRYGRPGAKGALVVVTHDRWFLDAVASRMWEVVSSQAAGRPIGAGVEEYDGGYAAYILARAERARQSAVASEKRNNLLRKELAWLRRGAPARTSKPKFRLDAAADLIADEPPPRDTMQLTQLATKRLGKDVLDLENVTFNFPVSAGEIAGQARNDNHAKPPILVDQTWRLGPGDRYGIVGVNGAGKSTLLALLTGRLNPEKGRVKKGKTVQVAELSQGGDELDETANLTAVQVIEQEKRSFTLTKDTPSFMGRNASGGGTLGELTAAQLVERLGFTRERAHTQVKDLSGGERRRLQLARLLVQGPNVLLLDEPTNDLDTDTLAAIEDLLDGWPGTLVVVSHDRYLLERVADRQWAMYGDGRIVDLPGGVDEYLTKRRNLNADDVDRDSQPPLVVISQPTAEPSQADIRQAKKDLARIEKRLAKIEAEEAKLHDEIAANPTNHQAVANADNKLKTLATERTTLEEDWLTAADIAG